MFLWLTCAPINDIISLTHLRTYKWYHIPEDSSLCSHCHENLNYYRITQCSTMLKRILCDFVWESNWFNNCLMTGAFTFPNMKYQWRWSAFAFIWLILQKRWAAILYLRVRWSGDSATASRRSSWEWLFQYWFVLNCKLRDLKLTWLNINLDLMS